MFLTVLHRSALVFGVLILAGRVAAEGYVQNFDALKGRHYRGCVLEENPYVYRDSTRKSKYNGVAMQYLDRLKDNLGFTIEYVPWTKTWANFIDLMEVCEGDGCPCDIGIGSFTLTNERAERINFVAPFSNEAHQMVSRKSDLRIDDSKNTWFVFRTFSGEVWVIIFVGVMMHALGTVFFGPFRPPERDPRDTNAAPPSGIANILWQVKRFPAAMLFAYAHLIGHPFGERAQGTPSFHRSAWLVLGVTTGLFLLTVYEASLTVLLFESTKESPFRTLQDIKNCAIHPDRVAMIEGGASQAFWNKAVNTSEYRSRCTDWGKGGVTVKDLEGGFDAVKRGRVDYFYTLEGSVLVRANLNCQDFAPVGQPFFSTAVAFVMANRTDKELHRLLSRETRILREQDGFETARSIAEKTSCDAEVDATITSGKLWAFFVLYVVTWAGLLIYRCVFLWRRKQGSSKPSNDSGSGHGEIVVMNMHSMPTREITGVTARADDSFDPFDEYPRNHFPPPTQHEYPNHNFPGP